MGSSLKAPIFFVRLTAVKFWLLGFSLRIIEGFYSGILSRIKGFSRKISFFNFLGIDFYGYSIKIYASVVKYIFYIFQLNAMFSLGKASLKIKSEIWINPFPFLFLFCEAFPFNQILSINQKNTKVSIKR